MRKWICGQMNSLLKGSHSPPPTAGRCVLEAAALIVCGTGSRRGCGTGLGCEASSRGKLGRHLEHSETTNINRARCSCFDGTESL